MAGKGGGAWKVAYADFVTAMMAFFMVMWIVAQGSKEAKEAVAQYFKEPFGPSIKSGGSGLPLPTKLNGGSPVPTPLQNGARKRGNGSADPTPKPAPSRKTNESARNAQLFVVHNGDRSMVGTMVLFSEGSAELNEAAKKQLGELAPMLVGKPNKIEVRGHTSRRPLPSDSSFKDPWQLCYARCLATMDLLKQGGVEPERIRLSQAGPFEPYTIRAGPENQARNSRVDVYLLPELAEDLIGSSEERAERFRAPPSPAGGESG